MNRSYPIMHIDIFKQSLCQIKPIKSFRFVHKQVFVFNNLFRTNSVLITLRKTFRPETWLAPTHPTVTQLLANPCSRYPEPVSLITRQRSLHGRLHAEMGGHSLPQRLVTLQNHNENAKKQPNNTWAKWSPFQIAYQLQIEFRNDQTRAVKSDTKAT